MSTPQQPNSSQPQGFGSLNPQQPNMQPPSQPYGPGPQNHQQSYGPQGYAQQQYGQQPPYPPQGGFQPTQGEPPKKKTALFVTLGVAAVVIIALVVMAISGVFALQGDTAASQAPTADPSEGARAAAQNYLTALSEGRGADALKLLDSSRITNKDLLTDEVVKDSISRAPITDIVVSDPVEEYSDYYTVRVSYNLGDTAVTDEYRVDGSKGIIQTSLPDMSLYFAKGIEVTINGATITAADSVKVFPGSYMVASANEYLEFTGEGTVEFTNSSDHKIPSMKLTVSQAGIDLFREKVVPEAKACLASGNLDPGCGLAISGTLRDGTTVADGSITRTQDAEATAKLESVTPEVGSQMPTMISASGPAFGSFTIEGDCTEPDGKSGRCEIWGWGSGTSWGKATIDLTDPEFKVVWSDS